MTHSVIAVGSSTLIRVLGLRDNEGNYQNDATVTLESLTDRVSGASVSGIAYPYNLTYVPASNGNYQAEISNTLGVVEYGQYIAIVKAVAASGQVKVWSEHVRAAYARA